MKRFRSRKYIGTDLSFRHSARRLTASKALFRFPNPQLIYFIDIFSKTKNISKTKSQVWNGVIFSVLSNCKKAVLYLKLVIAWLDIKCSWFVGSSEEVKIIILSRKEFGPFQKRELNFKVFIRNGPRVFVKKCHIFTMLSISKFVSVWIMRKCIGKAVVIWHSSPLV